MRRNTILITGGTTGIGFATSKLLAAGGRRVIAPGGNGVTFEPARRALPADAIVIRSDSASATDAQSLGAGVRKHVDQLTGVFFNTGVLQIGPIEAMTLPVFDEMLAINVRGPYFQLQSLLLFLANPTAVVFDPSSEAVFGMPMASGYSATKAAVVCLGQSVAFELNALGARVNVVSPGPICTPIYEKLGMFPAARKELEDRMATQSLSKRLGTAERVARWVKLLLSEESSYVVGENLVIDGGMRLV